MNYYSLVNGLNALCGLTIALIIFFKRSSHAQRGILTVISSREASGGVSITVADTGPGIPKEHLSHVFDPFFTTKEARSGLGLVVVHGIVSRHGGRIKAGNRKEGGAIFLINL